MTALKASLAEIKPCNKSCAPGYCYCECPHGVTDGNCKECYEAKATVPSDCTDSHQPLTIERLRDALVTSRIIPPAAVEDPDEYDDGVTLFRIEALHRRIT